MTPRLLVYGYGRRDSPRLQAALSAAIQLSAAVTPDVAEETVHEVRGRHLQGAAVLIIDITSLVLTTMLSLLLIGSGCVCRVYLCASGGVKCVHWAEDPGMLTGDSGGARPGKGLSWLCGA